MDDIETRLIEAIASRYRHAATPATRLASLGVDSLQMADLVGDLERRFGIEVDQDIFDVETVAQLASYLRERGARTDA